MVAQGTLVAGYRPLDSGLNSARWLAITLIGGVLWMNTPAIAANSSPWLRAPLSVAERLLLEGVGSDRVQLFDATGERVDFALCSEVIDAPTRWAQVPVLSLNRGLRLKLDASGDPTVHASPGVKQEPPWDRLILDLRAEESPISRIRLPANLIATEITLRSSPNLRQMSRPLEFQSNGKNEIIVAATIRSDWAIIELERETTAAPSHMEVSLQTSAPLRSLQWFDVDPNTKGEVDAPLASPVRGIRLQDTGQSLRALHFASRTNARDAWKDRGGWVAGDGPAQVRFNGVGDAQWQLLKEPAETRGLWQMAHDAREYRLLSGPALPIQARIGPAHRPALACSDARWNHRSKVTAIDYGPVATASVDEPAPPDNRNVRPVFLALLVVILGIVMIAKRKYAKQHT